MITPRCSSITASSLSSLKVGATTRRRSGICGSRIFPEGLTTDSQSDGQRLDRLRAGVLRFLHLRYRRFPCFPPTLLPFRRSHGGDRGVACDLWCWICRAADGRVFSWPLG